jgi:hypothetical protein
MALQQGLHVRPSALRNGLNLSDHSTAPGDKDSLAPVFDGVEQLCKIPRSLGRADLRHKIRLSDCLGSETRSNRSATNHWRLKS